MGYALFANRKLYYTNMVFELQQQLDNISQQKQNLLNFSANIADGMVTVEEIAGDASNLNNYQEFLLGAEEYANLADDEGGVATTTQTVGQMAVNQNDSEEYLAAIAELLNKSVSEKYANQKSKELEAQENQLDLQQKKIETKLTAAQQQLTAVEEAESKAIQSATPKYAGLG